MSTPKPKGRTVRSSETELCIVCGQVVRLSGTYPKPKAAKKKGGRR